MAVREQNLHNLSSEADSKHPRQVSWLSGQPDYSGGTAPALHRFPYSLVTPRRWGRGEHLG
jgi:hypothetical protein